MSTVRNAMSRQGELWACSGFEPEARRRHVHYVLSICSRSRVWHVKIDIKKVPLRVRLDGIWKPQNQLASVHTRQQALKPQDLHHLHTMRTCTNRRHLEAAICGGDRRETQVGRVSRHFHMKMHLQAMKSWACRTTSEQMLRLHELHGAPVSSNVILRPKSLQLSIISGKR